MKKKLTISALKKKVQKVFNEYQRFKFKESDGLWTCRSCQQKTDKPNNGHFFGTHNYNWLRFDEDNSRPECSKCNTFNHESLIWYTLNLKKELGEERFNTLLQKAKIRQPDFTREYLEDLYNYYKLKLKMNNE